MRDQIEMTRGMFYIIVALCATIIMMTSMEAMIKAKDTGLFEMWLADPNIQSKIAGQTTQQMYSTYLTMCLSVFFVRVITPIGLAIHSYLTLTKLRVNKLFVAIWIVLLIGSIAFTVMGETFFSIFFIISGICYFGLIVVMIFLAKGIYNAMKL